ncbi:MAG: glycoside hydrolase family 11 protein [Treponema sp.]|nr:glycoside hydrolase family 11 protein [Treponema sp.]
MEIDGRSDKQGEIIFSGNSKGSKPLPGSPYFYEIWSAEGNDNRLIWHGLDGGAAFRAEWNNPNDFLGRIGYYWNKGKPYTEYGNILCDFDFNRSADGTGGSYSYISIYGWSKNPMIEWYIVDDWFGNGIIGPGNIGGNAEKKGEFNMDGAVYFIYQAVRPAGSGNIEGKKEPFPQFFSIRQTRRQSGTISITEHFKEWEKTGMKLGSNMYEAKFLVEAAGGTGWFDASRIEFYQKQS